jgi:hypothetical protein
MWGSRSRGSPLMANPLGSSNVKAFYTIWFSKANFGVFLHAEPSQMSEGWKQLFWVLKAPEKLMFLRNINKWCFLDVERFIKKHKITRDDWRRVKITRKMIEDAKQLDIKLSPASGKTHTLHSRSALWISSIYFINMIRYTEDFSVVNISTSFASSHLNTRSSTN